MHIVSNTHYERITQALQTLVTNTQTQIRAHTHTHNTDKEDEGVTVNGVTLNHCLRTSKKSVLSTKPKAFLVQGNVQCIFAKMVRLTIEFTLVVVLNENLREKREREDYSWTGKEGGR